MFTIDRKDIQRIAISMIGALLLATASVVGVATGANQAIGTTATAGTVQVR